MRAVALLVSMSLLAACFPHNKHARTISKYAEGGSLVAGVTMEYFVNTGADCDMSTGYGQGTNSGCHARATVLGDVGVALILAGLLGFVATISTADEEDEPAGTPPVEIKTDKQDEKANLKLPPGVKVPASASASVGH